MNGINNNDMFVGAAFNQGIVRDRIWTWIAFGIVLKENGFHGLISSNYIIGNSYGRVFPHSAKVGMQVYIISNTGNNVIRIGINIFI